MVVKFSYRRDCHTRTFLGTLKKARSLGTKQLVDLASVNGLFEKFGYQLRRIKKIAYIQYFAAEKL